MGYFSNGSEGLDYEKQYCERCVHYDGCAVWLLHLIHNYDECNKEDSFLHTLIPRDGIENKQCKMFYAKVFQTGTAYPGKNYYPENKTKREIKSFRTG